MTKQEEKELANSIILMEQEYRKEQAEYFSEVSIADIIAFYQAQSNMQTSNNIH